MLERAPRAPAVRPMVSFPAADMVLRASAALWFAVTVAGQWIFAYYLLAFYGGTAVRGDLGAWATVLSSGGIIEGDGMGNVALAIHLAFAFVLMVGGPLQLVPAVRRRFPRLHRWNGRIYVSTAVVASVAGIYMELTRETVGTDLQKIGTGLGGVLVVAFGILAVRRAMARDLAAHRRWALRLFLAVSAVWFFRVGLMFWLLVNGGPVGFDPRTFEGPFLEFLSFAQYLLPLGLLELYLRARDRGGAAGQYSMAAGIGVVTVVIAAGIVGASLNLWFPHLGS